MSEWLTAAATSLCAFLAIGSASGEPRLGKYLCVTDYAAGVVLQPDGRVAAGKITVAPEKQKFFVTIRADLTRDFEFRRQSCFSKGQGEALKYEPPPMSDDEFVARAIAQMKQDRDLHKADPNYNIPNHSPSQFVEACLTNFIADISDHGSLDSFDGITFADYQSLDVVFELDLTNSFRLYERDMASVKPLAYNDTVYRGRCEFIQASR